MTAQFTTPDASANYQSAMNALAADFYGGLDHLDQNLGIVTPVASIEMPEAYRTLLCHHGHMTVTLEAWHESLVNVSVLDEVSSDLRYSRHSLLSRQTDNRIVQSGIMSIDLTQLPEAVKESIRQGSEPLGRLLIRSNLLREVELLALWRIQSASMLTEELKLSAGEEVFGRSARILVDSKPAVELLEIVYP